MTSATDHLDRAFMRTALSLARRGLGRTWPNPSVGCVIVLDGRVVGRGWTQPGGRPHAETEALRRAGAAARGATAYVSLEPCAHHGATPPCASALIEAGIARVVVAVRDPDPRVNGCGISMLRAASIEVVEGLCADEAEAINAGFMMRVRDRRPLITLKLATTLDGAIATHSGESKWITGPVARSFGHRLRAENDAIMIGAGTLLADDPELTCRLPGLRDASPVRVVLDGRLRTPLTAALVRSARAVPSWLVTLEPGATDRLAAFRDCGVEVIAVAPDDDHNIDIGVAVAALAERGITRVLVEGGSHVSAALLRARLVDRLIWFRNARVIGGDGQPAAVGFGVERLSDAPGFVRVAIRRAGEDVVEYYSRAH